MLSFILATWVVTGCKYTDIESAIYFSSHFLGKGYDKQFSETASRGEFRIILLMNYEHMKQKNSSPPQKQNKNLIVDTK